MSAVRQAVAGAGAVNRDRTLIADVGGGSTLLIVLEEGEISSSYSLRLGSIRLQEMFLTGEELSERSGDFLSPHIAKVVTTAEGSVQLDNIQSFVAVGGDVRFAAQKIGTPTESEDLYSVAASDFNRLVAECEHLSVEQTARKHGLPIADAETLTPALLVYRALLDRTKAKEMIVSRVSMRDGLLLDLARNVTGEEDEETVEGVLHSARTLAEKYRVDPQHARDVAGLSIRLFDEFQADHGLGARERLLLHVAAILHEVGGYVAAAAHHKHSYYLIRYSEVLWSDTAGSAARGPHCAISPSRGVPKAFPHGLHEPAARAEGHREQAGGDPACLRCHLTRAGSQCPVTSVSNVREMN